MEELLTAWLLSVNEIALIAPGGINWVGSEEGAALPRVTLQIVNGNRTYTHDGPSGLYYPRIQFNYWGSSYKQCKLLERAVLSEVEKTHQQGAVLFEGAMAVFQADMDAETLEGGTEVFRVVNDFSFPFRFVE